MRCYVAFLRGMNLGSRRIKNDELRTRFEELGFGDVATFRASGNVIFSGNGEPQSIATLIEGGLADALGYEVPVFLRSAAEVREIAMQQPFDSKLVEASRGKLQVSLLSKKPTAAMRTKVLALATDEDRLTIEGRELLLAAQRRHHRLRARPEGDRRSPRQGDHAHQGHDRADRRQALLGLSDPIPAAIIDASRAGSRRS